jgi:hypothetical protein
MSVANSEKIDSWMDFFVSFHAPCSPYTARAAVFADGDRSPRAASTAFCAAVTFLFCPSSARMSLTSCCACGDRPRRLAVVDFPAAERRNASSTALRCCGDRALSCCCSFSCAFAVTL